MFSTSLRRSAATLGVVTGLLAAAGPANAMSAGISGQEMMDAVLSVKAPTKAVVVLIGANDYGFANGGAQDKQTSLGRENSIECITLCHEGFEIR